MRILLSNDWIIFEADVSTFTVAVQYSYSRWSIRWHRCSSWWAHFYYRRLPTTPQAVCEERRGWLIESMLRFLWYPPPLKNPSNTPSHIVVSALSVGGRSFSIIRYWGMYTSALSLCFHRRDFPCCLADGSGSLEVLDQRCQCVQGGMERGGLVPWLLLLTYVNWHGVFVPGDGRKETPEMTRHVWFTATLWGRNQWGGSLWRL